MLNVMTAEESEQAVKVTAQRPEETRRMKMWLEERIAQGKRKPCSEVVTLTPVLAQLLLDRNPVNRPISRQNAANLSSDIAGGRFEFNGESIVISATGVLLDGQHRCQQVVRTGTPIETVLVFGPKDEARFTIDTGKVKTVSNFLAMKGRLYTHVLGSTVSMYLQWREHGFIAYGGGPTLPTKAAILEAADELKGIDTSIEFTSPSMKTTRCHAVLAFCHYVFWKRAGGREAADEFIQKVIDGDGLRKGNPILYCRNRLIGMGRGATQHNRVELIFKCWNAFRLGHGIDHCKLSGGKLPKTER